MTQVAPVPVTYSLRPPHAVIPEGTPLAGRSYCRDVPVETDVSEPSLTHWPAAVPDAACTAVIICPGGGYEVLATEHEGAAVARWLNSLGIAAFVLRYRVPAPGHPAPLEDARAAVRFVRAQAEKLGVRSDHVGMLGFSAGGHLAACAGILSPDDARPDFLVLGYPVVSMCELWGHGSSRERLLGAALTMELAKQLSPERHVDRQTPPVFLVHAADDLVVPVENSLKLFAALRQAGTAAELHVYERGGHGFGLGTQPEPTADWPHRCAAWLRLHHWLAST